MATVTVTAKAKRSKVITAKPKLADGLTRPVLKQVTPQQLKSHPITAFQHNVYYAIQHIPKGKLISYGTLAKALNSSPRAVGQALRKNPFAPTVPCHRIVASDRGIGGFCGETEGLLIDKKIRLLKEEGVEVSMGDSGASVAERYLLDLPALQALLKPSGQPLKQE